MEAPKQKYTEEAEPFIPYADEANCPDELRPRLDRIKSRFGVLPNSMRLYLHNPQVLRAVLALGDNIVTHPESALPRLLKVKLGVICSSTNGCVYCTTHQCDMLTRPRGQDAEGWGMPLEVVEALIGGTIKGADEIEQVCFDYAYAASSDPGSVTDELRDRMAKALTPAQCIELAAVIGFWKFLNTVHDSLSLPVEGKNLMHTGYIDAWAPK